MSMMNSMSRIRGQEKGPGYTQTEVILGEAMQKFGRDLGEESNFGEPQRIKSWSQKVWQTLFLQTLQEQSSTILFLQGRRKKNIMKNVWVCFSAKMHSRLPFFTTEH